jgi:hypothetical protein
MSVPRRPRPDDWSTNHGRARTALSDRLDGLIDPDESQWLDDHLAACGECRSAAEDYDAKGASLRAARNHPPAPPRDLWARTASAIERESGFRDRRLGSGGHRQAWFRSPLLPTALVVVVAVGTLISSQLSSGGATPARSNGPTTALASDSTVVSVVPGATPLIVGEHVQWISRGTDGRYRVTNWDVPEVCPGSTAGCTSAAPVEDQPVQLTTEPTSVFGSPEGNQLIVVNDPGASRPATISVVPLHTAEPAATPTPTSTATATPHPSVSGAASSSPSSPPTRSPGVPPSATPSVAPGSPATTATPETSAGIASPPLPSVPVTPSATPGGPVQIAENVVLVGQSAAYSPDFGWFAFTARQADGSTGPDIYLWKVGDPVAREMTTDHHSSFGSWTPDGIAVGSTIDAADGGNGARDDVPARSFLLDPATGRQTALPQTGRSWRPSVDPTGHRAVYWAGTLRLTSDANAYVPSDGRLVIGDWDATARPSAGPEATRLESGQEDARHETTIASGQITDWDARWDSTGTKLAVWIADRDRADVGKLSLYDVDPFNGRIDLKKPLLDGIRAAAGFSIADGKLVWAQPSSKAPGAAGRVLVFAWTDKGAGTIETGSDQVIVIR